MRVEISAITVNCVDNSCVSLFQSIKLIGTEKGKKGCTLLSFHAGNRVLKALDKSLNIEKQINTLMT